MNKNLFMENFELLNTQNISKSKALETALRAETERDFSPQINKVTVGLSTGTSGKRGIFLVSENERAQWAAMVMTRVIKPKLWKKQKVAFFLRANSNLYSSVQSALFEFRYFDIFQPIEQLAKGLNDFQPHVLAAQPSILCHLAEFQQKNFIDVNPVTVVSFAEVLYPEDKTFICSVFKNNFKEVYQCTEGFLGITCEHGTMHLNEDLFLLEKKWLDEKRFHPILTDFTRSTQPIVRYELDDILVESRTPCLCGSCFTALERIEGRTNDIFLFKTNDGEIVKIYPDLLARRIAQKTDDFRAYKVRQLSYTELEVGLDTDAVRYAEVCTQLNEALDLFLRERNLENIKIRFENKIPHIAGSKLRKFERAFTDEN